MAFPTNPSPGDTYTDEYGTVWVYAGTVNGWYRQSVSTPNDTSYTAAISGPAGSNTQVQFNDNGELAGDGGLTYNKTTDALSGGAFIPTGSTVPTNGVYLPSANNVAISTNGTGKLFIDSAGKVGLGTSSPGAQLHVATGNIAFGNTGSGFPYGSAQSVSVVPSEGLISFGMDGRDVAVTGQSGCYIWSGKGAAGQFPAGTLALQSRSNSGRPIVFITGSLPTERVRIDEQGRVGVGTTSPTFGVGDGLEVARSGVSTIRVSSSTQGVELRSDAGTGTLETRGSFPLLFGTGGSERARIDSSGRLLVGTSSSSTYGGHTAQLQISGSNENTSSLSLHRSNGSPYLTLNTGATSGTAGNIHFNGYDGTSAYITLAGIAGVWDGTGGVGDGPGRLVFSTTADGASSPTERMRIDSTGRLLVGTTTANPAYFNVAGTQVSAGRLEVTGDSQLIARLNRKTNDGDIIEFRQDGTVEGTISVSGTTVSYNGAHLSRWSQLSSGAERTEILRGSVLSNIDEMCEWGEEGNEQLNRMKVSDVEGDKNVSGVFQAWDDDDDTYTNDFYCAMTGDFIIRIAAGVTVKRGDLLMSAGDGTAKPQDDDIIRSKTIAKVTSTNVSCTYDDGSYCVPCVLMAC